MDERVALVTGSARGIGFSTACKLLEAGYHVIFNGITSSTLSAESEKNVISIRGKQDNITYSYLQADITTEEGRGRLLEHLRNGTGRIDVLVNNAGVGPAKRKDILEILPGDFDRVLKTNLEGPFFLTQAIARLMLDTLDANRLHEYSPCIVNISSISAYTASINRGEYCIAKAGVSMMTSLFAARLGGKIPVFEIRPGIILTDMIAPVRDKYQKMVDEGLLPINRLGTPDDVARAVVAVVSGAFPYSTGTVIDVDGGFHLRRL